MKKLLIALILIGGALVGTPDEELNPRIRDEIGDLLQRANNNKLLTSHMLKNCQAKAANLEKLAECLNKKVEGKSKK